MSYYQEVRLIPDEEVGMSFLWTKVYTQVHLALAEYTNSQNASDIGISFPEYHHDTKSVKQSNLGRCFHLIADDMNALSKLDLRKWLKRYEDYAPLSEIMSNKTIESHAVFTRFQPRNQASLRRTLKRRIEKNGESEKDTLTNIEKLSIKKSTLPSIHLDSLTTNQEYRLFIKKTEVDTESSEKAFTTYGLSKNGSTVPMF